MHGIARPTAKTVDFRNKIRAECAVRMRPTLLPSSTSVRAVGRAPDLSKPAVMVTAVRRPPYYYRFVRWRRDRIPHTIQRGRRVRCYLCDKGDASSAGQTTSADTVATPYARHQ